MVQMVSTTTQRGKLTPRKLLQRVKKGILTYLVLASVPTTTVMYAHGYNIIALIALLLGVLSYWIKEVGKYESFTMVRAKGIPLKDFDNEDLSTETKKEYMSKIVSVFLSYVGYTTIALALVDNTFFTPQEKIILVLTGTTSVITKRLVLENGKISNKLKDSLKFIVFWVGLTSLSALLWDLSVRGYLVIAYILLITLVVYFVYNLLLHSRGKYIYPTGKKGVFLNYLLFLISCFPSYIVLNIVLGNYLVAIVVLTVGVLTLVGVSIYHSNDKLLNLEGMF